MLERRTMSTMTQPRNLPNGKRVWLDGEVAEFVDHLTQLDPLLALIQCDDGRWEIWRVAEDGSEHIICRSQPGARLGPEVLQRLAAGDTRASNPFDKVIRANELVEKHRQDDMIESTFLGVDRLLSKAWHGRVTSVIEDTSL